MPLNSNSDAQQLRAHLNQLAAQHAFVAERIRQFKEDLLLKKLEPPADHIVKPLTAYSKGKVLGVDEEYYQVEDYAVVREGGEMRIIGIRLFSRCVLGCESLDGPGAVGQQLVKYSIVQPSDPAFPKLNLVGPQTIAAPVIRTFDRRDRDNNLPTPARVVPALHDPGITLLCGDAHAPIWLSRGRV